MKGERECVHTFVNKSWRVLLKMIFNDVLNLRRKSRVFSRLSAFLIVNIG